MGDDDSNNPRGRPASFWRLLNRYMQGPLGAALLGALVLGLTLLAWHWLSQNQRTIAYTQFQLDTRTRVHALDDRANQLTAVVRALEAFYAGSLRVHVDEFEAFSQPFLAQDKTIHSLQWITRVRTQNRSEQLREIREEMGEGFRMLSYRDGELSEQVSQRDEYFPVTYLVGDVPTEVAHGFDWGSVPTARAALDAARDRAAPVMSAPIDLPASVVKEPRVVIFAPIYRDNEVPASLEERREALVGFVAVSARLGNFLEEAFGDAQPAGMKLFLVDVTEADGDSRLLYPSVENIDGTDQLLAQRTSMSPQQRYMVEEPLQTAGRQWRIVGLPTATYVEQRGGVGPVIVLVSGCVLSAVIVGFMLALSSRARSITTTVERRTAELRRKTEALERSEQDLIEAKRAAEQASEAKSELLAHMSHDLRTPLNGVLGFVTLMRQTELDDRQTEYADVIEDSARTLLRLVEQVLDLSKVESGVVALAADRINLRERIDDALRVHESRARDKGLSFELRVHEDLPSWVIGDWTRLRQVLDNLLANAIKFTDQGAVSLDVVERWRDEGDICLEFIVEDTGIGVPEEERHAIFEAFSRVETPLSRQFGGVGLGLAIAHRLVNEMGGRIWLESTLGEGSVFHFTVPMALSETGSAREYPSKPSSGETQVSPLDILLVEDSQINRKLVVNLLEPHGHRIVEAVDGQEAVDKFEVGRFDVVLMDIQLPKMSGIQATEAIRDKEPEGASPTPIVALTAHAMKGDRQRFLQAGMDDYLSKPIDPSALEDLLARISNSSS